MEPIELVTISKNELREMITSAVRENMAQMRVEPLRLLYTKDQAMELFSKSESCIDNWIRDGRLQLIKMGGASYISGNCIANWLQQYEKR